MLRTVAGILPPTAGRVTVWGEVTPLLSLGVGFNRELTGRENILLGGLTRGLRLEEVYANFDAVEQFAGLGDAIDFPMRTYSSGMFGRLAFSVAAHLNPRSCSSTRRSRPVTPRSSSSRWTRSASSASNRTAPC